ncbi:hypothetical protein BD410DRAFT_593743 [Rickenella mellea]|uniref:Uncharacterized protein n=1 Tax=Rickenella mellea TaxID=50990 RepID=A0A4Y7QF40_9AGAM|nr:hypothetical protein BD410DRAFT_593743 [Rickenella mellea]
MSTLQTDAIPTTHPIAESGVDASIDSVRYDEEGEIAAEDASPISQIAKPAVPLAGVEQACHTEDIAEDAIADGSNTLDVNLVADALQSTSVEESQPLRRIVSSPEHVLKTTEEKERHQYVEPNALETPAVVESAKFEPSEPTNSTNISHHSATTPQTSADATLDHHVPSLGDALNLAASTNIGVGGNAPVHNDTTHSSPNTSHVIPTIEDEIPEPTNKLGEQAESPVHQHAESTPVDEALTHSTSESHPTDAEVGQESYTEPEIIAEHSKQTDGGFTAPTVEHAEPEHVVPTDPVEAKEADDTTTTATIVKADGSSEGTSEPVSGSDVHTDTLSGDGEELPSTAVQAEPIETKEVSHADVPEDVITGANAEAGHAPSGVDVTQVATAAVSVESEPTLLASELPEHEQSANVDPTKHEIDLISFDDPKPPIPDHEFMVERSVPAAVAAENDEHVSEKESSWPSRPHHESVNEQDLASESNGHVSQNVETKPPIPHHETPSEMVVAPAVEAVAHDHVSDKAETNPTTVQADEKAPINDLELSLQTDIPPSGEREIDSTQQEEKTPPSVHNDHSIHTVLDDEHRDPIHEGDADPKEVEQTLSGRDVENGDSVPSVMEGDGVQATSGVSDNTPDTQEDTVPSDAGHVAQISDIDDARTPMAKHTMLHAEGPYISTGSNKNEPALDARPPTDDDHFKEIWASAVIANTHESNENEPVPDVQPTKDDDHFKDLWASAITANSHAQYPPDSPVPIGDEAVTSPIPEVSIEHPTPGTEEVLTPGLEEPQSDEETHPEHSTPAAVTVSTDRSDEEKRLTEDDKTDSAELLTPTAEETPGESATAAELIAPASMKIPEEPEVPNAAPHEPAADTLNFAKDASPTSQTAEAPDATGTSDGTVGPDHEKTILNDDNVGDIPAVAAVKEEIGDEVAPEVAIDGHADLHDESISTTEFTPPAVSEPAGPVSAESVPEPDSNEVAVSTDKEFSDTTTTISDSAYLTSEDVNPVPQPIASATEKVASASLPDGETVLQANTVGAEESLEHEPSSNIPSYSVTAQGQAPVNDSRKLVRDSAAADIHHVASEHSPDKMGEAKSSIEEVQPLAAVSSTHASTSDAQEIHVVALQEETAHAEFSDVQDGNEQSLPSDVTVHEATVSSFTPSYSVTVQGANELKPTTSEHIDAPPLDEPPANANDQLSQDDTSDADASTPRQISEPLQPSELPSQIPEGKMADDVIQDKNALSVERATGPTEIANYEASNDIIRPKSPYAPSYAVTQQGPGTPPATNDDAEPELFADETDLRSDIPEVPMSPRSELAMYTPTFDSRSEVSVASLEPLPPASPRLDPEELIVPETTTDETTAAPTLNLTDLPHGEEEIGTATPLPTYRQPEWSHDEPTASDMDRVESAVSEAGVPAASSGYSAGDEKSTVESTDHNDERSFGVPDSPNVESAVEVTSDVVQPGVLSSPEPDGQHVTLGSGVTEPTAGERSEPSADQAVVVDVSSVASFVLIHLTIAWGCLNLRLTNRSLARTL